MPHLAGHARAVAELARVLVPGGALALTMWNRDEFNGHVQALDEAVEAAGAAAASGAPAGPDPSVYADDDAFAALLEGAGLVDVTVQTVDWRQKLADLDDLWLGVREGGVRFAAFLAAQDPAVLDRIRSELDRTMSRWATGDGYEFPMSAKLASGRTPR
jgi:SAM-dependent methyltransferase